MYKKVSIIIMLIIIDIFFISTVIHIKKMSHCKEKLEQLVSHRLTLMPFHKLLHKSHDTLKAGWKCSKTTHNHECIALSFIFEQLLVTFVKCACKPFVHLLDKLLSCKKIFFFQHCTVHFSCPVHKIVCFIHKKHIIALCTIAKISLKRRIRVKYIIIITYNSITPVRNIKRHLKRADIMPVGIFHDIISSDNHLARYNVIHSIINSVKMPLGIWACHRVAVTFLKWTYFVLRCKSNSSHMKPVIPQNGISILRNSPRYCL